MPSKVAKHKELQKISRRVRPELSLTTEGFPGKVAYTFTNPLTIVSKSLVPGSLKPSASHLPGQTFQLAEIPMPSQTFTPIQTIIPGKATKTVPMQVTGQTLLLGKTLLPDQSVLLGQTGATTQNFLPGKLPS